MNVRAIEARYQIKIKPGDLLVRRLKTQVKRFEKRYEVPTAQMLLDVRTGKIRETKEIEQWMQSHSVLGRIISAETTKAGRQARLEHVRKLPAHLQSARGEPSVCRRNKTSA